MSLRMFIPGFSCQLSVAGFDPGASDGVFVHLVWRDNRHWLITSALLVIGALAEPHSHNLSLPQEGRSVVSMWACDACH